MIFFKRGGVKIFFFAKGRRDSNGKIWKRHFKVFQ